MFAKQQTRNSAMGLGGLEALIAEALNPGYNLSLCWGAPKDLLGRRQAMVSVSDSGAFKCVLFVMY